MECGQIFLLACRQLRKEAQHNFIGQFKNLLNLPMLGLICVFTRSIFFVSHSLDYKIRVPYISSIIKFITFNLEHLPKPTVMSNQ